MVVKVSAFILVYFIFLINLGMAEEFVCLCCLHAKHYKQCGSEIMDEKKKNLMDELHDRVFQGPRAAGREMVDNF